MPVSAADHIQHWHYRTGPLTRYTGNIGTSFAVPMVSAIAGLMHALNDDLSSSEMIARMKRGARPFPAPDPSHPDLPDTRQSDLAVQLHHDHLRCRNGGCAGRSGRGLEADGAHCRTRAMRRLVKPYRWMAPPVVPPVDAALRAYQWSVSGSTAEFRRLRTTGATATLQISAAGTANVQLTVTDDVGGAGHRSVTVDIAQTAATRWWWWRTDAPAAAGWLCSAPAYTAGHAGYR